MVGAGVLVTPLLGFDHYIGVIMVGAIVITIVATAGMTSTTYVQFLKGSMLIVFSLILVISLCYRGLSTTPDQGGKVPFYKYKSLQASGTDDSITLEDSSYKVIGFSPDHKFVKLSQDEKTGWWSKESSGDTIVLQETQWKTITKDGETWINGALESPENKLRQVGNLEAIKGQAEIMSKPAAWVLSSFLPQSATKPAR